MAFDINNFKGAFKNGGLRTSFFEVNIFNPASAGADIIAPFRIQAASIPEAALNSNDVAYFGRVIKVAGSRTFADWSTTVMEDEDMRLRDALEAWSSAINSPIGNVREFPTSQMSEYKSDAIITAFSQTGEILRKYKMIGMFPTNIGPITMAWENNNVATFECTWVYDFWIPETGGNTSSTVSAFI